MIIKKKWAMPNKNTFDIKPIKKLIYKYFKKSYLSIDPFANKNKICKITNDIDTYFNTDYSLDALDFCKQFDDNTIDFVLFDPPYSPRQISECYKFPANFLKRLATSDSSVMIFFVGLVVPVF